MTMAHTEVYYNARRFDIAREIGIANTSLSRWLEQDLDPSKENRIAQACERIAQRYNDNNDK